MPLPQAGRPSQSSTPLSETMRTFARRTILLFAFSMCFHLVMYSVFHRRNWFAFPMDLHREWLFADFKVFTPNYLYFHTARFFTEGLPMVYPTPVAVLFAPFFLFARPHEVFCVVSFCVLAFIVPAALFAQALHRRGVQARRAAVFAAIICVLSWPAGLIVNGANSEVFVWIAMAIAMWAYATGRLWTAAIMFGVAASLKLFPFVFLTLFLSRKNIPKAIAGALTFGAVMLASFAIVGPTIGTAYHGFLSGMAFARDVYFAPFHGHEQGVDHSIFGSVKFALKFLSHAKDVSYPGLLRVYQLATAAGGVLLYFLVIRKLPLLNQVLVLSIICIYFTPFSGDGTLIHLYYPLVMLFLLSMRTSRQGLTVPGMAVVMACMVFCLSMESFLVIPHPPLGQRVIGPAHAIALGIMLIAALRYPFGPPLSAGYDETVLSKPVTDWLTAGAASIA